MIVYLVQKNKVGSFVTGTEGLAQNRGSDSTPRILTLDRMLRFT